MIATIKIHEKFMNSDFNQKNERSLSGVLSEVLTKKDYDKVSVIVSYIEEHGSITPREAEKIKKKSAATVRRYFKILVGTKYVAAEGNTNNIIYHVSEDFI